MVNSVRDTLQKVLPLTLPLTLTLPLPLTLTLTLPPTSPEREQVDASAKGRLRTPPSAIEQMSPVALAPALQRVQAAGTPEP